MVWYLMSCRYRIAADVEEEYGYGDMFFFVMTQWEIFAESTCAYQHVKDKNVFVGRP